MGRLGFISYFFIGLAISAICLTFTYEYHVLPDREDAANQQAYAEQLQANAELTPKAVQRRNQAVTMVNQAVKDWQAVVATKTPPTSVAQGGIDMNVSPFQMTLDARVYRNNLQRFINKQLKIGGVTVVNGPMLPMPSDDPNGVVADFFNYPAIPFPVVIFDLGQVTVEGTYEQIETNVRAWARFPHYLAVADGLAFTGTAPILTGTYSVSIVGYIKADVVYPTIGKGSAVPPTNPGAGGAAPPPATGTSKTPPAGNKGAPAGAGKGGARGPAPART